MNTTMEEFTAMMKPHVLAAAGGFLEEERRAVELHVASAVKSLVVFGDQTLLHWSAARRRQLEYLLVDPHEPVIRPTDPGFRYRKAQFDALTVAELPSARPRAFVFSFNLYSYLDDPSRALASMLNQGDLVCVSNWTSGAPARSAYLRALEAVTGKALAFLDSDPLRDLRSICSWIGHRATVWREVQRESTQCFLRCL